jgi:hypothetical protein
MGMQAMSREQSWPLIDHLDSAQARAAAQRLEEIMRRHTPLADVLREEEWHQQAGWLEAFRTPNWRKDMIPKLAHFDPGLCAFTISKKQIIDDTTGFLNALIANARLPYAARQIPPLPDDPIVRFSLNTSLIAAFKESYFETQKRLLLVSLALRAYELEHGQYPDSLTALSPSYLTKLPDDPFAASGTLHYRRTGKSYLLYSVGPDGKDDGGTPCAGGRARKIGEAKFQAVDAKSTGDIVAGVNVR